MGREISDEEEKYSRVVQVRGEEAGRLSCGRGVRLFSFCQPSRTIQQCL